MMPFTDEYTLVEVDAEYLNKAVKIGRAHV